MGIRIVDKRESSRCALFLFSYQYLISKMKDIVIEELLTVNESEENLIGRAYKPLIGDYTFIPIIARAVLPYYIQKSSGRLIASINNIFYSVIINGKNILIVEVYASGNITTPHLLFDKDRMQFEEVTSLIMKKKDEITRKLINTVKIKLDKMYARTMYFLTPRLKYPEFHSIECYIKNMMDNPEALIEEVIW
jgi:hypothetical protein